MTKNALRRPALALAVAVMGGAGDFQLSAADYVVDTFNDATSLSCWYLNWGPLVGTWDGTQDNTGGNSGALSLAISYTNDPAADNSFGFGRPFCCACSTWDLTTIDASRYREVAASVRWDTNSTIGLDTYNTDGEHGLVAGFWTLTNGMITLDPAAIPDGASNGWVRMSWPINPALPGIDRVSGILIKKWDTQTTAGNARFWLDDITLVAYPCCTRPPPMMSIQMASPGLNLFTGTYSPYDRENIRTARGMGAFSWLGSGDNPVSYSFTVTNVECLATNFQVHIFLVTNPGDESAPDWNELSVLRADLLNVGPDNHGQWTLSYKTNQYGYGSGIGDYLPLGSISNASMLGTWTLKFQNDTNVTLTGPSGAGTNFTMPLEVANNFPEPLLVYFGVQANEAANEGRAAALSSVTIDGNTVTSIHESFGGPLDTNVWEVIAGYPPGVQVVSPGSMWVQWTTPDAGYYLQTNSVLNDTASWSTNGLPVPINLNYRRQALIAPALGPASGQSLFFRMSRSPQ